MKSCVTIIKSYKWIYLLLARVQNIIKAHGYIVTNTQGSSPPLYFGGGIGGSSGLGGFASFTSFTIGGFFNNKGCDGSRGTGGILKKGCTGGGGGGDGGVCFSVVCAWVKTAE